MAYQTVFDLSALLCMPVVILAFLAVFEPRYPKPVYLASLIPFLITWIGANTYLLFTIGNQLMGQYLLLTCTLSSLIYFFCVAKRRDGRFFFTFCLVDTIFIWLLLTTNLLDYAVGGEGLVATVLRLILYPTITFAIWHFGRKPYLMLLNFVSHSWWLFSLVSGLFYVTMAVMAAFPCNIRYRPEDMPVNMMILMLLPLTYATIFLVLWQQWELFEATEKRRTFEAQSAMMEQRVGELLDAEERYRFERHNLRHRLLAIGIMLQKNDTAAALDYIGASQEALDATEVERYCTDPALDAILGSYFRQAKEQGIQLEAHIDLPDALPVPSVELSTVFANALENMLHAVRTLPPDKRRIICRCISSPCLMMEFCNPCGSDVQLGPDGLPIARNAGHGIGTRSIAAFAEKHQAVCTFQVEDGWFKLRLAM